MKLKTILLSLFAFSLLVLAVYTSFADEGMFTPQNTFPSFWVYTDPVYEGTYWEFEGANFSNIIITPHGDPRGTSFSSIAFKSTDSTDAGENAWYFQYRRTDNDFQIAYSNATNDYSSPIYIKSVYPYTVNLTELYVRGNVGFDGILSGNGSGLTGMDNQHAHDWANVTNKPAWMPTYLSSDVTATSSSLYSNIFEIPLTKDKMNIITGHLATLTGKSGDSYQIGFNYSAGIGGATNGSCWISQSLSASTSSIDYITPVGGAVVDTAETANLCLNFPCDTPFTCDIYTNETGLNLDVWITGETTSAATAKAGSFYQLFVN